MGSIKGYMNNYNTIITELGDHSVPKNWEQFVVKRGKGETPGPPIIWSDPQDPEEVEAGYGYIADDTNEEETFFYHSDHLGSTSYITDDKGNVTQYTAYLPYGELLVDEHSSSEDLPYKFNGKELDDETGLYYYGARYLNPTSSLWYGVDPLAEKMPAYSAYAYCLANPVKLVDPDGSFPILINGRVNRDSERGSSTYWSKEVKDAVKKQTGYNYSQFKYVDGDKGMWPSTRYNSGIAQGKADAKAMYAILKASAKDGAITEQIQVISHSRGAAFASGYMKSLSAEIAELALKDNLTFAYGVSNIIEYSVNLAPHQSNYINYYQSGAINVNVSHYGDILSGNDATGNVINIHSNVDTRGGVIHQHSTKNFGSELNGILNILENNKGHEFNLLKDFYNKWDNGHNVNNEFRNRGFPSTVERGRHE